MLCVIQSAKERSNADWEMESARTGHIYLNAKLTLMASWLSHSDCEIFVPSTEIGATCRVMANKGNDEFVVT
jgi:hypothetical protein